MTDAEEPKDNSEESGASNMPEHDDGAGGPESEANSPEDQTKSDAAAPGLEEDELPEEEELTPELVEEEAIRGDFMLRWATIFLAVLFGFSQMADTRTLVHIRSGEDLRANGFLPSGQDSLSYAASDKATANVSWLFDHVVSAVFAVGGPIGLTLFKALTAGLIAYLLSLISCRGMPTWWNSICCAFAISACSVDFLPITDLATLTGLVVTLLLLQRYDEENQTGLTWKLPLLVAIWANLDPRAYLGVFAIVMFAIGSKLRQSRSLKAGDVPGAPVSTLWKAALFSLLALLVNPAPVNSLFAGVATYSIEYPSMAAMLPVGPNAALDGRTEYSAIWAAETSAGFEFAYVAGMAIILITIVVLYIARNRNDLPWATTFIGFTILAGLALHELPAASMVAAVTAGLAAQRWYGRTFRQEYSVAQSELLFSRGGRAITVLAFAFLAFVLVADRLPTRTTVGIGFETDLAATMDSLEDELKALPDDAQILNTRLSQGDLLIWHGRQSFLDSRVTMFGRPDDEKSVMYRFDRLRRSLIPDKGNEKDKTSSSNAEGGASEQAAADSIEKPNWLEESDGANISHVMIRLTPPGPPPYSMILGMLRSSKWQVASRGPSALFFRNIENGGASASGFDIREPAFQEEAAESRDVSRVEFARPKDFYQQYIYASRPTRSAPNRAAQHFFTIDSQFPDQAIMNAAGEAAKDPGNPILTRLLGEILAGPILTIRSANEAIKLNPRDAEAFRLLGLGYRRLDACERAIAAALGGMNVSALRYGQSVMALQQAATIAPKNSAIWSALSALYQEKQQTDLALECMDKFLALIEKETYEIGSEQEQRVSQMRAFRQSLFENVEQARTQMTEYLEGGNLPEDPQQNARQKLALAEGLYGQGHLRLALNLINDNQESMRALPTAELLRGTMMMEAGELEDGFMVLSQLADFIESAPDRPDLVQVQWHTSVAAINMGLADYAKAKSFLQKKYDTLVQLETQNPQLRAGLFESLPLRSMNSPDGLLPHWTTKSAQTALLAMSGMPRSKAEPLLMMAMIDIEAGRLKDAEVLLKRIVTECNGTPQVALAAVYLRQLTKDADNLIAEMTIDPWEVFSFTELATETDSETPPTESASTTNKISEDTRKEEASKSTGKPVDDSASKSPPQSPETETAEPAGKEAAEQN